MELDRQNREAQVAARQEMTDRHIKEAMMLQGKVLERLRTLKPNDLNPSDVAKWFDIAVKIERLARGESTENVNQEVQGQVVHTHDKQQIVQEIINTPELAELIADRFRQRAGDSTSG